MQILKCTSSQLVLYTNKLLNMTTAQVQIKETFRVDLSRLALVVLYFPDRTQHASVSVPHL